jgi:Uma2 family endonuclease
MEITSIDQLDLNKTCSYADYLLWKFDERLELIKGKIFAMSSAPNRRHQVIAGEILFELNLHFKKHQCQLFYAPFDVRLPIKDAKPTDKKNHNVVQPDLCVICDEAKLDK